MNDNNNLHRNPNVDYSLLNFCSTVKVTDLPAMTLLKQVQNAEVSKGNPKPQGGKLFALKNSYLIDWSLLN